MLIFFSTDSYSYPCLPLDMKHSWHKPTHTTTKIKPQLVFVIPCFKTSSFTGEISESACSLPVVMNFCVQKSVPWWGWNVAIGHINHSSPWPGQHTVLEHLHYMSIIPKNTWLNSRFVKHFETLLHSYNALDEWRMYKWHLISIRGWTQNWILK